MAMLKLPLDITIVAIMTNMAILSILTIAQGENNIAMKGIKLKGLQKQDRLCKIYINPTFCLDFINMVVILSFSRHFLQHTTAN